MKSRKKNFKNYTYSFYTEFNKYELIYYILDFLDKEQRQYKSINLILNKLINNRESLLSTLELNNNYQNLSILNLSNNQIIYLPDELINIKSLNIMNTQITKIPKTYLKLEELYSNNSYLKSYLKNL